MVERIERRAEPRPDRPGARRRQLLAGDNGGKPGKAGLATPQRRHAREFKDGSEARVLPRQRMDRILELGLGVEMDDHCDLKPSCPVKEINAACLPLCAEPERLPAPRPRL